MTIKSQVLFSFALMLGLLAVVAGIAIQRTQQIERLAGELNSRVVDKTRVAASIFDLCQQIHFLDTFLLRSDTPEQVDLARAVIKDRAAALDAQIGSYAHLGGSSMERTLLQNLEKSRDAYRQAQTSVLGAHASGPEHVTEEEDHLTSSFDQVRRQARGLSLVAETEARSARQQAVAIASEAQRTVLIVAGLALATGLIIVGVLFARIFSPLARITEVLIALSQGRHDVSLIQPGRSGEIARMAQALDVFQKSAVALANAHEETKAAHKRADALARHDALTGLPNRRVLKTAIESAIERSQARAGAMAVLVLDLDRFKPVNDIYGHGAGDRVLCEVTSRLSSVLRSGDTAARLGGDEFALVLEFDHGSDAPHRVAKRIISAISKPIVIEGRSVTVGTSIGIAVWPADGLEAEALLHAADLAMFRAKSAERGSFRFFEAEMDVQLRARADLEVRISRAIQDGHILPHYQPLVDLATERVVGFEVLARWLDGGTIRPPADFIQVADEAGLMPELTYSLLRQACRDARKWDDSLTLAVNVTPAQIADKALPQVLLALLKEEDFPPNRLELEITENALIGDIASAKHVMESLRGEGIRISLDDFGTGYSSLHHLRDLKFDKIKIDRSFVQAMPDNSEATKIVETILGLGRSLGINTIAEGVEGIEHMHALVDQGCRYGQGYHFGKPLAALEVGSLLAGTYDRAMLTTAA